MTHRLVLDTNVVASALLWSGTPARLLQAARERRIGLFTSEPLLLELTDILGRGKFDKKVVASGMTIAQLVERYALLAAMVTPSAVAGVAPDPDDDVVLGTAVAARAEMVVTGDLPLRDIATYQGIRIVGVTDALERIAGG